MKNGHQGAGLVSCVQFPIIKGDAVTNLQPVNHNNTMRRRDAVWLKMKWDDYNHIIATVS